MNELPSIAEHAKQHGIIAKKSLGQNFLLDFSLCRKIAQAAGSITGHTVLEIGPGIGGLTRAILREQPRRLIAIEKDQTCLNLLSELKTHHPQLDVISGDAMAYKVADVSTEKVMIIANLPYNIGTVLLCQWLEQLENISSITVTLQKEVADRICGKENNSSYGRLSIISQLNCYVAQKLHIAPQAFHPAPKVHSAVVHLVPKQQYLNARQLKSIEKVSQAAFSQRRKMIKTALGSLDTDIERLLRELDINPNLRPEQLSPNKYLELAKALYPDDFN